MTQTMQNKALTEFLAKMEIVKAEMAKLQSRVDNHLDTDPDSINWANVGDASFIALQLKTINDSFVFNS